MHICHISEYMSLFPHPQLWRLSVPPPPNCEVCQCFPPTLVYVEVSPPSNCDVCRGFSPLQLWFMSAFLPHPINSDACRCFYLANQLWCTSMQCTFPHIKCDVRRCFSTPTVMYVVVPHPNCDVCRRFSPTMKAAYRIFLNRIKGKKGIVLYRITCFPKFLLGLKNLIWKSEITNIQRNT